MHTFVKNLQKSLALFEECYASAGSVGIQVRSDDSTMVETDSLEIESRIPAKADYQLRFRVEADEMELDKDGSEFEIFVCVAVVTPQQDDDDQVLFEFFTLVEKANQVTTWSLDEDSVMIKVVDELDALGVSNELIKEFAAQDVEYLEHALILRLIQEISSKLTLRTFNRIS